SNANLSKRHMEEQNKILRDIASMIEKTQIQQITIANQYNETTEHLKKKYEERLNKALINMDKKQILFDGELKDLYAKTQMLVNEVIFAKRLFSVLAFLLLIYIGIKRDWYNVKSILMAFHSTMNERIVLPKLTEKKGKATYNFEYNHFFENSDQILDANISRPIEQIRMSPYRSKHNLKNSRGMLVRPIRRS
ncbi:8488_t:CDS:2, partial [Acaulospora morrowiae]